MITGLLKIFTFLGSGREASAAPIYPAGLNSHELSDWHDLFKREQSGKNDEHFNALALAYACATKRMDSIQYLFETNRVRGSRCSQISDILLEAITKYQLSPDDQVEVAKLLTKYGIHFQVWNQEIHGSGMTDELLEYLYQEVNGRDAARNNEISDVPDYLADAPFAGMSQAAVDRHFNTLALSFAMMTGLPAEAEFLVTNRQTPIHGTHRLMGEPVRAVLREQSERMIAFARSYGALKADTLSPTDMRPA